ncbi:MAG: hypothetical protein WDO18_18015 [Acidobacteriota bacterium]
MHIKAVEALFELHGKLPVNVKFLIEGEEECGGEAISGYLPKNTAKLKADVALLRHRTLRRRHPHTLRRLARPHLHRN